MVIKDLYVLMEKKNDDYTHWSFTIYVDGISHNILAYANAYYDICLLYTSDAADE